MGLGGIALQEGLNFLTNWWSNWRSDKLGREAAGIIGEASQEYVTPDFSEFYDPYNYDRLNREVDRYIEDGAVNGRNLAQDVGRYFSDASTDAFERSSLADIAAGSDARSRSRIQQTVGSGMARGRGLDEMGDALGAMQYQEDVARGGQALGIQAEAEGLRNQTNLARGQAMSGARITGEQLRTQLTQLGAGLKSQIGLAQGDEQLRAALAALSGEQFNAQQRLGAKSQEASFIAGIPVSPYYTNAGTAMAQINAMKPKSGGFGFSGYDPLYGGGGINIGGCVDGETVVMTPLGSKPLRSIGPTDQVMGDDWKYHKVVGKDYGDIPPQGRQKYIKIGAENAAIIATSDHVIGGKRADEWRIGDLIDVAGTPRAVTRVEDVEYVASGDLCLEGNVNYFAGGFSVQSQIGRDLDAYRDLIDAKNQKAGKLGLPVDGLLRDVNNPEHGWVRIP